jgi:hypothetical protein
MLVAKDSAGANDGRYNPYERGLKITGVIESFTVGGIPAPGTICGSGRPANFVRMFDSNLEVAMGPAVTMTGGRDEAKSLT